MLAALIPTRGITISWTGFTKENLQAGVRITVVGRVLGSMATPFSAKSLMGAVVEVPVAAIFRQIMIIVFLPLLLGQITHSVLVARKGCEHYQTALEDLVPILFHAGSPRRCLRFHGAEGSAEPGLAVLVCAHVGTTVAPLWCHLRFEHLCSWTFLLPSRWHCACVRHGDAQSLHCPGFGHDFFWPRVFGDRLDYCPGL